MPKTYLTIRTDEGDGKPLVLLHGLGNNAKSWSFVLKHLDSKQHRIIAPDLLGFGDSPKPMQCNYTPADHADAVIKTLDELKITNALIAGHSMGSIVAIEVARKRPDLVRQLALFGAPLYETVPKGTRWKRLFRLEGVYFTIFSIVKKNPDALQAGGQITEELVPFVKGLEITEETWSAYRKSLENTIMQCETYGYAKKLTIPTLFVNGLFDFFIIRNNIKEIAYTNKQYVRTKTTLGPHEITPTQGKRIARLLSKLQSK